MSQKGKKTTRYHLILLRKGKGAKNSSLHILRRTVRWFTIYVGEEERQSHGLVTSPLPTFLLLVLFGRLSSRESAHCKKKTHGVGGLEGRMRNTGHGGGCPCCGLDVFDAMT